MNTKAYGTRHGESVSASSATLFFQRETIIKRAQENVRASHQRMRNRRRSRGACA